MLPENDLPIDDDDGLLLSIAEGVEKKYSQQLIHQLFTVSQPTLSKLNVLFYMVSWAARSVAKVMKCADCKEAMFALEPFDLKIGRLTLLKQRGGLMYPSRSIYRVAYLAYQSVQLELVKTSGKPPTDQLWLPRLEIRVFAAVAEDRLIFEHLRRHDAGSLLDAHLPRLVKAVASKIILAFLGHLSREHNEKTMGAASNRRNHATRMTIFKAL